MKKNSYLLLFMSLILVSFGTRTANDKYYTLSATVTVKPGQSVNISVKNGLLSVEGEGLDDVPSIAETAPLWLRHDLKVAFSNLSKAADRIGKGAFVSVSRFEEQQVLLISSTGKKPVMLKIPGYDDISNLLPATLDKNARLSIADINSDKIQDIVVCPTSGGYYYLPGPKFMARTNEGNVSPNQTLAQSQLFPITSPEGNLTFAGKPVGFGFFNDQGLFAKCDQANFVTTLPNAYGALSSIGLYFIDANGDLRMFDRRLTGICKPEPYGYISKSENRFPTLPGKVSMTFSGDKIMFGTDEGKIIGYKISKDGWKPTAIKTGLKFGPNICVQAYNGCLYYRDTNSNIIYFSGDPDWNTSTSTQVHSISNFAVNDADNDGSADLAVINKNKLSILAGPSFSSYIKTFEEWNTVQKDNGEIEDVPLISENSNPAFGDINEDGSVDLIIGGVDGRVCTFLGPDFKKSEELDWIDVGNYAIPQFGDVDGDGKNELLVSNSDSVMFCYKRTDSQWNEWNSWNFLPSQNYKKISDYYDSYMSDAPYVQWKYDPETVRQYSSLLENCEPRLFDEISFVIANTAPEILRTMSRMGQADILERNARTIYEYAPTLPYLKLVEKDHYTTISYKISGKEVELPRDDYYWYIVHPRISFELPIGINCTWWDREPAEYGLSQDKWLMHEENFFKGKPTFWREAFKNDKTYGESVIDAAKRSRTYEEAMANVFSLKSLGSNNLFNFGYLTNDLYPWQIYKKHYGSCGENSILFTAMSRTALLPCYAVIDQGEDHQWNEVWMPDGWRHLEPSSHELTWDQPWKSTEDVDHKAKMVSAVFAWKGDDSIFATTTTVHNSKPDYTKNQKGYTDTADVNFTILDSKNNPVEGGMVVVRTGWNKTDTIAIWGYTDVDGKAHFDLGYEPYYIIDVVTPYGITGLSRLVVNELQKYELTLNVPGEVGYDYPNHEKPVVTGTNVTLSSISDELRPLNFITSRNLRTGGYLVDNFDYHGPLFIKQQTTTKPVTINIDDKKFQVSEGEKFGLGTEQTMTITNENLYTWETVRVEIDVPVEYYLLKLTARTSKDEVKTGDSIELHGTVDHTTPINGIEYSWDNKIWKTYPASFDRWMKEFSITIPTQVNDMANAGEKQLFIRCQALTHKCIMKTMIAVPVKFVTKKDGSSFVPEHLKDNGC